MIAFWALVRKDILLFLIDRRALLMSFAVPIAIASFFGYVFGGGDNRQERSRISLMVVDEDRSAVSREIMTLLSAEKTLLVNASDVVSARDAVRRGKATVAVVIPKDFGRNSGQALFRNGDKAEVTLLYDPSHDAERGMIQGILTGEIMQAVSKEIFSGPTGRDMVKEALGQIDNNTGLPAPDKKALQSLLQSVDQLNMSQAAGGVSGGGLRIPFNTLNEAVTSGQNTVYNGYAHAFAGMTVQFVLFLSIDVGIGLLLQRQRGLWKRFRAAPLSRSMLLGSRTLSAAIIAFIVLQANFLFARFVFGVRVEGSWLGFFGVCAAFSFAVATFGLLIAALGKTPDGTRGLAIFVTLMAVMLGGAWVPTFLFPQWLQRITVLVPTRWAIDGLEAVTWRGLGIASVLAPISVLLAFAALFGALAVSRFRWEQEG